MRAPAPMPIRSVPRASNKAPKFVMSIISTEGARQRRSEEGARIVGRNESSRPRAVCRALPLCLFIPTQVPHCEHAVCPHHADCRNVALALFSAQAPHERQSYVYPQHNVSRSLSSRHAPTPTTLHNRLATTLVAYLRRHSNQCGRKTEPLTLSISRASMNVPSFNTAPSSTSDGETR